MGFRVFKINCISDVTFDETSVDSITTEVSINSENTKYVDVPGGDIEEMNDNIDLSLKSNEEKEPANESESDMEFQDAQNSSEESSSNLATEFEDAPNSPGKSLSGPGNPQPPPQLRRSSR